MAATSNLVARVATAIVGVPLVLALLFFGPAWGFFLLVAAASCVGAIELFAMTHPGDRISQTFGVLMTLGVSACVYFATGHTNALLTVLIAAPIVSMLVTLWRLGSIATAALRIATLTFGPLYIGAALTTLALLRRDLAGTDGPGYVVLALGFAWLSDTGGYFAGRFLGKHKLYEAVSPKKTVEGALGGLAATLLFAVVAHVWFLQSLPLGDALALAVLAGALGQLGDLGESLIKRSVGVKDSGAILPGHGGILDRLDAVIVTSAVCYLYVLWART